MQDGQAAEYKNFRFYNKCWGQAMSLAPKPCQNKS